MAKDGKDPAILDRDPEKPLDDDKRALVHKEYKKKEKKIRRKRLFWETINPAKNSIWNELGSISITEFDYDEDEFLGLFTADVSQINKSKKKVGKKEQKKLSVIDGKRAMNGSISLARLKLDLEQTSALFSAM